MGDTVDARKKDHQDVGLVIRLKPEGDPRDLLVGGELLAEGGTDHPMGQGVVLGQKIGPLVQGLWVQELLLGPFRPRFGVDQGAEGSALGLEGLLQHADLFGKEMVRDHHAVDFFRRVGGPPIHHADTSPGLGKDIPKGWNLAVSAEVELLVIVLAGFDESEYTVLVRRPTRGDGVPDAR